MYRYAMCLWKKTTIIYEIILLLCKNLYIFLKNT